MKLQTDKNLNSRAFGTNTIITVIIYLTWVLTSKLVGNLFLSMPTTITLILGVAISFPDHGSSLPTSLSAPALNPFWAIPDPACQVIARTHVTLFHYPTQNGQGFSTHSGKSQSAHCGRSCTIQHAGHRPAEHLETTKINV